MVFRNESIAVNASREISLPARDLSSKHVGWAYKRESYIQIADPIFITKLAIEGQQIVVTGFSVEYGNPVIHKDVLVPQDKLVLFPDLRLATITPNQVGSVDYPVEALSLSLPRDHYDSANARKDKRNGWRVESFEGNQARLIRQ